MAVCLCERVYNRLQSASRAYCDKLAHVLISTEYHIVMKEEDWKRLSDQDPSVFITCFCRLGTVQSR